MLNYENILFLFCIATISWLILCYVNTTTPPPVDKIGNPYVERENNSTLKIVFLYWMRKILRFFYQKSVNLGLYFMVTMIGVFILINVVMGKIKTIVFMAANQEYRAKYFEEITKVKNLNENLLSEKKLLHRRIKHNQQIIQQLKNEIQQSHVLIQNLQIQLTEIIPITTNDIDNNDKEIATELLNSNGSYSFQKIFNDEKISKNYFQKYFENFAVDFVTSSSLNDKKFCNKIVSTEQLKLLKGYSTSAMDNMK